MYYPVYGLIPESEEVLCEAVRNLRFDNCEFIRLTPKEMPDARRHGAVPKPSPDNFIHVKDISLTNTTFSFSGDFSYKNDYDWTVADR